MNGKAETARMAYREAREEVLQRIAHRDRAVIAFLAAVGALFAAVLAVSDPPLEVLYVIGPLSLGAAMIVHQHSISVARLVAYVRLELTPTLQSEGEYAPLWEESEVLKEGDVANMWLRTIGEFSIIVAPFIAALVANWKDARIGSGLMTLAWWISFALLVLMFVVFGHMHRRKNELLERRVE